ncbi:MAG TPA: TIGR04283 family arsenosugar biosynthesis glycosyltransferase [Tepidisphaeraceae bacterium]|nr:TIGR04283 family arsenosugar biosynthesis glycosyltransferase [Tepidisphaeraceae bacterium]
MVADDENRPPRPKLSVIVPVLNEAAIIGQTLTTLRCLFGTVEVIVVDGGSSDGTVDHVHRCGCRVITAPAGRGAQMHAGAVAASGEVLWFLHADTLPPPDAIEQMVHALRDPLTIGGNFSIRFDGDFAAARFLTRLYRYLSWIGLRYGDSAYFVRRSAYFHAGGFQPFPIFEDLDLMRRLRRIGRFVRLPAVVRTSSRRFENRSFALVFLRWTALQSLYWLGVSPARLGRWYHHVRIPGRVPVRPSSSPSPTTTPRWGNA